MQCDSKQSANFVLTQFNLPVWNCDFFTESPFPQTILATYNGEICISNKELYRDEKKKNFNQSKVCIRTVYISFN